MDQMIFMQLVLSEKLRYCEQIARIFIDKHWINSCREDGSVAELEELMDFSSGIWSALVFEQQIIDPMPDLLRIKLYDFISKMEAMEELARTVDQFQSVTSS